LEGWNYEKLKASGIWKVGSVKKLKASTKIKGPLRVLSENE
jgi:hypothetical protein